MQYRLSERSGTKSHRGPTAPGHCTTAQPFFHLGEMCATTPRPSPQGQTPPPAATPGDARNTPEPGGLAMTPGRCRETC